MIMHSMGSHVVYIINYITGHMLAEGKNKNEL